jgi:hypothetical protein
MLSRKQEMFLVFCFLSSLSGRYPLSSSNIRVFLRNSKISKFVIDQFSSAREQIGTRLGF